MLKSRLQISSKKLHTQKYTISKIQVSIILVFYMFGLDTCFIIFSKFYIQFRTCISLSIHYISLAFQNSQKSDFWPRSVDQTVDQTMGQGLCMLCTSLGRPTANPSGRPIGRSTVATHVSVSGRSTERSTDPIYKIFVTDVQSTGR